MGYGEQGRNDSRKGYRATLRSIPEGGARGYFKSAPMFDFVATADQAKGAILVGCYLFGEKIKEFTFPVAAGAQVHEALEDPTWKLVPAEQDGARFALIRQGGSILGSDPFSL